VTHPLTREKADAVDRVHEWRGGLERQPLQPRPGWLHLPAATGPLGKNVCVRPLVHTSVHTSVHIPVCPALDLQGPYAQAPLTVPRDEALAARVELLIGIGRSAVWTGVWTSVDGVCGQRCDRSDGSVRLGGQSGVKQARGDTRGLLCDR